MVVGEGGGCCRWGFSCSGAFRGDFRGGRGCWGEVVEEVVELQAAGGLFEGFDDGGDAEGEDGGAVDGLWANAADEHFAGATFEGFQAAAIEAGGEAL